MPSRGLVAFWVTFWAVLGWFFWYADRRGFPLCKAVRYVYGTDTRGGRFRLGASLTGGTVVLYRHLVKPSGSLAQ